MFQMAVINVIIIPRITVTRAVSEKNFAAWLILCWSESDLALSFNCCILYVARNQFEAVSNSFRAKPVQCVASRCHCTARYWNNHRCVENVFNSLICCDSCKPNHTLYCAYDLCQYQCHVEPDHFHWLWTTVSNYECAVFQILGWVESVSQPVTFYSGLSNKYYFKLQC